MLADINNNGRKTIRSLFIHPSPSTAKLLALVVGSFALMLADHHYHQTERLRAVIATVVYPIQAVVSLPAQGLQSFRQALATRDDLQVENEKLRAQNMLLKSRLQKFSALESENQHLRELLDSSVKMEEKALVADILDAGLDINPGQITINKGSYHNVYLGQPVVDSDGIMGQVVHVSPFTSVAMLITNPSHALPVQINRNGVRGVAEGRAVSEQLELKFVPLSADVKPGDLITTSGIGGRFPAGYPVGEVLKVQRTPGAAFATISVSPSAKLGRTQQVLLIWLPDRPAALAGQPEADTVVQ